MSFVEKIEHYFKPEVRRQGETLFKKGQVNLSQPSDTQVQAFIRTSTPAKVSFRTDTIADPLLRVDCNCSSGKKGQLCKHIWATLSVAEKEGHLGAASKLSQLGFTLSVPDDFEIDDFETAVTRETLASRQAFTQASRAAKGTNAATGVQPAPIAKPSTTWRGAPRGSWPR